MIAIPAIDLRDGACVQLVGGDPDDERVRRPDPVAVASEWRALGFSRLHVVDLDAAMARGSNRTVIRDIVATVGIPTQVGGGLRSVEAVQQALETGAAMVVVGTRAVTDASFVRDLVARHPARVIVALDARDGEVMTHGWTRASGRRVDDFAAALADLPLAGVLVTAIEREGRLGGTDLPLMRAVARATSTPLIASGGVATFDDLRALADAGVAGAVIGMALYTGALDPRRLAQEFAA